jgi:4-amino-4-deoxy-L-arabinose transferase-like glycosyltransferase
MIAAWLVRGGRHAMLNPALPASEQAGQCLREFGKSWFKGRGNAVLRTIDRARVLLIVLLAALLSRLLFLTIFGGFDGRLHDSFTDQNIYLDLAHNVAAGHGFVVSHAIWIADVNTPTSIMPPLYPLLVALSFRLFGESLLVVRLLQLVLSLVMVAAIYLTGRMLFGTRVAFIAGLLTALYPPLVMYVRPLMSEALFLPLIAVLVLLTAQLGQGIPSRRLACAWGIVAGLAILTRTEAALLAGLLLAWLIYRQLVVARPGGGRAPVVVAFLALSLTLLPYACYNYAVHGAFSPLPNARWKFWDHTWWAEVRKEPAWQGVVLPERQLVPDWSTKTERARDAYLGDLAMQFVREHPRVFIYQRLRQLYLSYPVLPLEAFPRTASLLGDTTRPDGYAYGATSLDDDVRYLTPAEKIRGWSFRLAAVGALLGIILMFSRRQGQASWLLLLLLWNVLDAMAFVGSERMRLQIDAYFLLFAAYALSLLLARVMATQRRQALAAPNAWLSEVISADD